MPYNLIRHLGMSVFRNPRYMAMFTAHFDASGNKRTTGLTVVGCVSTVDEWAAFQSAWKKLLPPTVDHFHMTDFVSSKRGWEEWEGKSNKRARLIQQLVDCIRKHVRKGFADSVVLKEYNNIDSRYKFSERFGKPYSLAATGCLKSLVEWARKKGINYEDVLCLVEDGDDDQGDFVLRSRADKFNVIPQSKKNIRAFDACDLLAWKSRTAIDDVLVRRLHEGGEVAANRITRSLLQTEQIIPRKDNGFITLRAMQAMCNDLHIEERKQ